MLRVCHFEQNTFHLKQDVIFQLSSSFVLLPFVFGHFVTKECPLVLFIMFTTYVSPSEINHCFSSKKEIVATVCDVEML